MWHELSLGFRNTGTSTKSKTLISAGSVDLLLLRITAHLMSTLVVRITSTQKFSGQGSLPYQILFTVSSFSVIKQWQVAKIQQMSILCHSDGVNQQWNEAEISWPHWSVLPGGSHRASPQSVPLQSGFLWQLMAAKFLMARQFDGFSQSIFTGPVTLTSSSKGSFTALQILLQLSRCSAIQCFWLSGSRFCYEKINYSLETSRLTSCVDARA